MNLIERGKSEYLYLSSAARMLRRVTPIARKGDWTYPDMIEDQAKTFADRPALLSDREQFTYRQFNQRGNRYARWALAAGLAQGDVVCLMMPNRPEYLAIWLGVARMGGVTALLNTHVTGATLAHSIDIVRPKHVIVAAELADAFATARPHLETDMRVWSHGGTIPGAEPIEPAVDVQSAEPLADGERPQLTLNDRCLYIYTSGTTGRPKAANVNHYRIQAIMHGFSAAMNASPDDRTYVCLPLYHSAGGVLAVGACLSAGGSAFIRERFSASEFWPEIVEHGCTMFQYIGEICRYLVNTPEHPAEDQHTVRLVCGNGLRPDIWPAFQTRFGIRRILEYYAATEGNVAIFNFDSHPGSVGRIASWARHRFPIKLIRVDTETDEPLRGPDGLCQECAVGEAGELVSEIVIDPKKPAQRFDGYADEEATRRKLIGDVARKGDRWFRSGDLLYQDRDGYYYFVDRIGDTFRCKGENVSTMQVAEVITTCPGVDNATVYGVQVGQLEGKVGMATIVPGAGFDLERLHRHCVAQLADYARPAFIRIAGDIEVTGTYKQRKLTLEQDGFDPDKTDDQIYFDDPETGCYQAVDKDRFAAISAGRVRL